MKTVDEIKEEAPEFWAAIQKFLPVFDDGWEGCEATKIGEHLAIWNAAKEAQGVNNQYHAVESIEPVNGGMGPDYDIIKLKNSAFIEVGEEGLTAWESEYKKESGEEPTGWILFK